MRLPMARIVEPFDRSDHAGELCGDLRVAGVAVNGSIARSRDSGRERAFGMGYRARRRYPARVFVDDLKPLAQEPLPDCGDLGLRPAETRLELGRSEPVMVLRRSRVIQLGKELGEGSTIAKRERDMDRKRVVRSGWKAQVRGFKSMVAGECRRGLRRRYSCGQRRRDYDKRSGGKKAKNATVKPVCPLSRSLATWS